MSAENKVNSPRNGQIVYKNSPSEPLEIEVSGHAEEEKFKIDRGWIEHTIDNIYVSFDGGGFIRATYVKPRWPTACDNSCTRSFNWGATETTTKTGPFTILVRWKESRTGESGIEFSDSRSIRIALPPAVDIVSPSQNSTKDIPESGTSIELKMNVTDGGMGIERVIWEFEGRSGNATATQGNASEWTASVGVRAEEINTRSISVYAVDRNGKKSQTKTLTFIGRDITPPSVEIRNPKEDEVVVRPALPSNCEVEGTVKDPQSGVKTIKWSLDGQNFSDITRDNSGNWRITIPLNEWGFYALVIRVKDYSDVSHPRDYIRQFKVVSAYKPESVDELLSPRSYLDALLEFTRDHVRKRASLPNDPGPQMDTAELTRVFYQPFGKLREPSLNIGDAPINRLRVPIEALRSYSSHHPSMLVAHWRCDEGNGAELKDSGPYHHNGALKNGASWGSGRLAGAVVFDGSNHVEIPGNSSSLELGKDNADFSVAFWFCLKEGPTGKFRAIMQKGNDGNRGGPGSERTFALWMSPDANRIHFAISTDEDPNANSNSTNEVVLNAWTHIAYVKVGDQFKLYLNGRLDAVKQLVSKTKHNNNPIYVGKSPWWDGVKAGFDDIRIYSFGLSDETVHFLAQARPDDVLPSSVPSEVRYLQTAYEALLNKIGTSYTELRLIKAADAKEREALANRLGIRLDSAGPDRLEQLLPPSGGITEEWLETAFGFRDTKRDPSTAPLGFPILLRWQQETMLRRWHDEDHPIGGDEDVAPIIDPDLIDFHYLKEPSQGNPAYDLFADREKMLAKLYDDLIKKCEADTPARETFDTVTKSVLGAQVDLPALAQKQKDGKPIAGDLRTLHLPMTAFKRLMHVRTMAEKAVEAKAEWEDVCNILVQAHKEREYANWWNAERTIVLSSEHFVLSNQAVALRPWRASYAARFAWQTKLKDRSVQWDSLESSLRASVAAAEEIALPILRDALLTALADQDVMAQVADDLTERLLVDMRDGGSGQTTRIMQAAETLQEVVYSVRIKRITVQHPAYPWVIEEEEYYLPWFDDEWRWMGSHANWRAARMVFLYPENFLQPKLWATKDAASGAFKQLARRLDKERHLTQGKIDQILKDIRQNFTDEENGFFKPMLLAEQLQKSRGYVAALDWYRKVYSFNLPLNERKKSKKLVDERNGPPTLRDDDHWTRDYLLDPYVFADGMAGVSKRPNPYTRYTLMAIARCFSEYADSEFASDTSESVAKARALYLTAKDLLWLPDLDLIPPTDPTQALLPNEALEALRSHVDVQLGKIRSGCNIAGLKRQLELIVAPTAQSLGSSTGILALPSPQMLRPTPYRFHVLVERSKQLVNISQQIEAAYFSALEKRDIEEEKLLGEGFKIEIGEATVQLQRRRSKQSTDNTELAKRQRSRFETMKTRYDKWISGGQNEYEVSQIKDLKSARDWRNVLAATDATISALSFASQTLNLENLAKTAGLAIGATAAYTALQGARAGFQIVVNNAELSAQVNGIQASYERRKNEWTLQRDIAEQDIQIGDQQILIAQDQEQIAAHERVIAEKQKAQAEAMRDFLINKFTSRELYDWMVGVLGQVYSFFLQQATSLAQLAQNQLAFERQEFLLNFIQSDYWKASSQSNSSANSGEGKDRLGLTGSARLLQDIYQLDQHAFSTDRRKLNLAQTFSLSRLAPYEFQLFKETGVLPFATPMHLFDQGFPGHYHRLIKRVRTSVVALVPPTQGIRATLSTGGITRVVIGPEVFREVVIHRDPEFVALTSPSGATGVFELDTQSDMLLPFEGMGVDAIWEFELPKAANPFDFSTIADVLITIEYTALHSYDYRQQVIAKLDRSVSAERTFSIKSDYPDEWYELNNPDHAARPFQLQFETTCSDFPPNLIGDIKIEQLLLYVVPKQGSAPVEGKVFLTLTPDAKTTVGPAEAQLDNGLVSTRRTSGNSSWGNTFRNQLVTGNWMIGIEDGDSENTDNHIRKRLQEGTVDDIFLVVSFSGQRPDWPS